ncbi:hypothetical protein AMATHDRAFT_128539, partial [Amanita thiersii Skay4041]
CMICQCWDHPTKFCKSKTHFCARCRGVHPTTMHKVACKQCKKGTLCEVKCVNCEGPHMSSSDHCPFFKARNN